MKPAVTPVSYECVIKQVNSITIWKKSREYEASTGSRVLILFCDLQWDPAQDPDPPFVIHANVATLETNWEAKCNSVLLKRCCAEMLIAEKEVLKVLKVGQVAMIHNYLSVHLLNTSMG